MLCHEEPWRQRGLHRSRTCRTASQECQRRQGDRQVLHHHVKRARHHTATRGLPKSTTRHSAHTPYPSTNFFLHIPPRILSKQDCDYYYLYKNDSSFLTLLAKAFCGVMMQCSAVGGENDIHQEGRQASRPRMCAFARQKVAF